MSKEKEARRLRRQKRKQAGVNPRRLTEAGALELAIAVAQHFYYEYDNPIMTDAEYDRLEVRYLKYLKKSGSPGGIAYGILDKPGSADTLKNLLLEWRK
jgi:hypothetical protein